MTEEKIYRNVELIANEDESREISGRAVVFNSWSRDLGGFIEIIKPESITPELLKRSDIVMCINHDENKMVARYRNGKGTLKLELDNEGLNFRFEAPRTQLGDELLYNVREGNLFECSFAFTIPSNGDYWFREDGQLKREIRSINGLYDCSIVNHAAYPETSCSARFLEVKANVDEIDKALETIKNEIDNL